MTARLVADIGNTRIKWGLHEDGSWLVQGWVESSKAARLGKAWAALAPVDAALATNVAGVRIARSLAVAARPLRRRIRFVKSAASQCGVKSAYSSPAQLGPDRWAALIAARHLHSGACLVVNTGTTLTATTGEEFAAVMATFHDDEPGMQATHYDVVIDWGDGSPLSSGGVSYTADGYWDVAASHTYAAAGSYTITITIADTHAPTGMTTIAYSTVIVSDGGGGGGGGEGRPSPPPGTSSWRRVAAAVLDRPSTRPRTARGASPAFRSERTCRGLCRPRGRCGSWPSSRP